MKKIMIIALLSLSFAFLAADYDAAFNSFAEDCFFETIGDISYWIYSNNLENDAEAIETAAQGCLMLLLAKSGWEKPSSEGYRELAQEIEGVGALYEDEKSGIIWLIYIDMDEIMKRFNYKDFYTYGLYAQLDAIYDFIEAEGTRFEYLYNYDDAW